MIERAPIPETRMTYDEAVLYCQFLEYKGYTDWRLPNYNELRKDADFAWLLNDSVDHSKQWWVIPVRTVFE